jgi:hypothetical protein
VLGAGLFAPVRLPSGFGRGAGALRDARQRGRGKAPRRQRLRAQLMLSQLRALDPEQQSGTGTLLDLIQALRGGR